MEKITLLLQCLKIEKINDDVITFVNSVEDLEQDFIKLSPILKKESEIKLINIYLKGKWSVYFLYDS